LRGGGTPSLARGQIAAGEAGKMQLRDGSWAVAYGLTIWGLSGHDDLEPHESGSLREALSGSLKSMGSFFKKFMP